VAKFSECEVWNKVPEGSILILEIPKFLFNTVWDRWKEASMPKTSSIRLVVPIQYWLVTDGRTDGRTDGHATTAYAALA